jgi:hypothetical protein
VLRFLDSGFYCCRSNDPKDKVTKTKTIDQYVKLYGGPVYLMHFKYSSILNQVWVSFFYGMFLPILFPIALIGIINMYIVERITLAWFYRQPPSFDGKLNDATGLLATGKYSMEMLKRSIMRTKLSIQSIVSFNGMTYSSMKGSF